MRTQELRPCLPSPPCSASSVPSSVTPDHGSRHWVLVQSPRSSWAGRFSLSLSKRGNLKLDKVSRLQTVFPRILYPLRIFRGTLGVGQGPRKGQTQPEHRTYTSFSGTILIDKNLLYLTWWKEKVKKLQARPIITKILFNSKVLQLHRWFLHHYHLPTPPIELFTLIPVMRPLSFHVGWGFLWEQGVFIFVNSLYKIFNSRNFVH